VWLLLLYKPVNCFFAFLAFSAVLILFPDELYYSPVMISLCKTIPEVNHKKPKVFNRIPAANSRTTLSFDMKNMKIAMIRQQINLIKILIAPAVYFPFYLFIGLIII
jgi:hypothetical protein